MQVIIECLNKNLEKFTLLSRRFDKEVEAYQYACGLAERIVKEYADELEAHYFYAAYMVAKKFSTLKNWEEAWSAYSYLCIYPIPTIDIKIIK